MDSMGRRGGAMPPKPDTASAIRRASTPSQSERPEQPTKRVFDVEFKARVVREVEQLGASGERGAQGAFIRREGITWTHVRRWQKEQARGGLDALAPKKRGPKLRNEPATKELEKLRREKERLQEQLRKAEIIIDVQKKLGALLGIEMPVPPDEEEQ